MANNEITDALVRHLTRAGRHSDQPLGPGTKLLDGTLDSLALIELVSFVEAAFDVPVPHHDVAPDNFATVADLSRYVAERQHGLHIADAPGPDAAD
jgi:acyl carrier protein